MKEIPATNGRPQDADAEPPVLTPKPAPPRRPIYGKVTIGKSRLRLKIDWAEYEADRERTGKAPTMFTLHGYNKTYRVSRERVEFDLRYFEDQPPRKK